MSIMTKKYQAHLPPVDGTAGAPCFLLAGHVLQLAEQAGEPGRQGEDVHAAALRATDPDESIIVDGDVTDTVKGIIFTERKIFLKQLDVDVAGQLINELLAVRLFIRAELGGKAGDKHGKLDQVEGATVIGLPMDGTIIADHDVIVAVEDDGSVGVCGSVV